MIGSELKQLAEDILDGNVEWSDEFFYQLLNIAKVKLESKRMWQFLKKLNVGYVGRLVGVFIFVLNINILYLQSTAMTEPLLLATMTAGCYYLLLWSKDDKIKC